MYTRELPTLQPEQGVPVVMPRRDRPFARALAMPSQLAWRAADAMGRAFDLALAPFAPNWAAHRMHSRQMLAHIRGAYQAGDMNRLTAGRTLGTRDPDSELQGKHGRIRAFARDEVRNSAVARNLKQTHIHNTVGDADVGQGFTIDPAVQFTDGSPDVETNKILKLAWQLYRDRLEYTGRWGFADMLTLNDAELFEAGEVLNVLHDRPAPGSDLPFSVEMLEADRLPTSNESFAAPTFANGETLMAGADGMPIVNPKTQRPMKFLVKHGIVYDENKQIVAYDILKDHPGNQFLMASIFETQRFSREKVIHYFRPERAEQSRGVSWLVPALRLLADLNDLISWELLAAKAQSVFGIHFGGSGIPNQPVPSHSANPPKDMFGNTITQLQPAMVTAGDAKAEFYQGNRPGGTFLPFFMSIVRLCGAAVGIGYSGASKDISQSSYSGLRHEDNEDARAYRAAQGLHARHFCRRVWAGFVRACAIKGLIPAKAYLKDPARYERCEINVPGRAHINPLQEMMAQAVGLRNGILDPDEVLNVSGKEPEDRYQRLAALKDLADKLNLELGWITGEVKPAVNEKAKADPGESSAVTKEDLAAVGIKGEAVGDPNDEA